jgi:predicted O-methyltransferase YrrM
MSATKELMAADPAKSLRKLLTDAGTRFSHSDCMDMQDPTGISNEEGELLYGLVRATKPKVILETGTNIGISTAYMALACRDNGFGHITTIEHLGIVAGLAEKKLSDVGLLQYVSVMRGEVADFKNDPTTNIDFMWLDTEFHQRYAELVRFFPLVSPGGIICIHDLWRLEEESYGGVPSDIMWWIRLGHLRALTFATDSGVTVFQKRRETDYLSALQGGIHEYHQ